MNPICTFMASGTGRSARVIAGLALIVVGLFVVKGTSGTVLAAVGALPLLTGALDICLLGALFGCPVSGAKVRAAN